MITYKKINSKNQELLTPELIKSIYDIDTLIRPSTKSSKRYIQKFSYDKYSNNLKEHVMPGGSIYLIHTENKLLGAVIGKEINDRIFTINFMFIRPDQQKQGIGTKLLFHVVADISANTKYESIEINPLNGTKEILDKITGKREMKNNKTRKYKTTKFIYSAEGIHDIPIKINIQRYQKSKSLPKKISTKISRYMPKNKLK